jgi:hypothetical protein
VYHPRTRVSRAQQRTVAVVSAVRVAGHGGQLGSWGCSAAAPVTIPKQGEQQRSPTGSGGGRQLHRQSAVPSLAMLDVCCWELLA